MECARLDTEGQRATRRAGRADAISDGRRLPRISSRVIPRSYGGRCRGRRPVPLCAPNWASPAASVAAGLLACRSNNRADQYWDELLFWRSKERPSELDVDNPKPGSEHVRLKLVNLEKLEEVSDSYLAKLCYSGRPIVNFEVLRELPEPHPNGTIEKLDRRANKEGKLSYYAEEGESVVVDAGESTAIGVKPLERNDFTWTLEVNGIKDTRKGPKCPIEAPAEPVTCEVDLEVTDGAFSSKRHFDVVFENVSPDAKWMATRIYGEEHTKKELKNEETVNQGDILKFVSTSTDPGESPPHGRVDACVGLRRRRPNKAEWDDDGNVHRWESRKMHRMADGA